MINFEAKTETLTVSGFPTSDLNFTELQKAFDDFKEAMSPQIKNVVLDLENVTSTDYSIMTFLISCGDMCHRKKISISFVNANDEKLMKNLEILGFKEEGKYDHLEYRQPQMVSIYEAVGDATLKICSDTKKLVGFIGESFQAIFFLIRNPHKLDLHEVFYYIDKSGADAMPIVSLICFLVGVILAFQGLGQLEKFGLSVYVADLVGLSMVRELGPLMVAMICIGRAGSAYAAELGTMKVNEELDAMNTMGLKPARFLVLPKILALMIVMPMLTIIGDFVGIIGGMIVSISLTDISITEFYNRTIQSLVPANVGESMLKGVVFAFLVAAVGCFRGFEADNDAKGVGKAATSSVVSGIFLVVIADFIITFVYPIILGIFGIKYH